MTQIEEIYRKYFSDVYRFLLRLSGDEGLAEEMTSETFLRAMEYLPRFRGECDIRVWLCQIGKNIYFAHQKRSRRTESLEEAGVSGLASPSGGPEEAVVDRDQAARIRRALRALPDRYREVFAWRVYGELDFREIGRLWGRSANWACVTYHRAKDMIRMRLEDEDREK